MLTRLILPFAGLLSWVLLAAGYPNGAPPGICTLDMKPKHNGIQAQESELPFELFMSKDRVTSMDDQIIVTIKSRNDGPAFRGFLVLAKDKNGAATGTWVNDDQSHPLQGCSGTTHDGPKDKREVNLIWKPQDKVPDGPIEMKATIVQRFDIFWVNLPVNVKGSASSPAVKSPTLETATNTNLLTSTVLLPKGGIAIPGLASTTPSTSTSSSSPITSTSSSLTSSGLPTFKVLVAGTTTPAVTTTKRRSFIDRLLGRGGSSTTGSSTAQTTTTTTTTSAITTTAATTTVSTTAAVTTTKKLDNQANRKIGIDQPNESTTVSPTTTTAKSGFFKRLFSGK